MDLYLNRKDNCYFMVDQGERLLHAIFEDYIPIGSELVMKDVNPKFAGRSIAIFEKEDEPTMVLSIEPYAGWGDIRRFTKARENLSHEGWKSDGSFIRYVHPSVKEMKMTIMKIKARNRHYRRHNKHEIRKSSI